MTITKFYESKYHDSLIRHYVRVLILIGMQRLNNKTELNNEQLIKVSVLEHVKSAFNYYYC